MSIFDKWNTNFKNPSMDTWEESLHHCFPHFILYQTEKEIWSYETMLCMSENSIISLEVKMRILFPHLLFVSLYC
jgi:hypothetical protein